MRISDWSSDVCSSDLVRALPDGAQLCVGTRALPGSMLARMQIGDGALSFSDSDLCFRLAETVAFFSEFRDLRPEEIAEIHDRTGGWPAADRKSTRLNSSH